MTFTVLGLHWVIPQGHIAVLPVTMIKGQERCFWEQLW